MNIIESNGNYQIYNSIEILDKLPKGVYAFDCNLRGPFLAKLDNLVTPKKVYSNDKVFLRHLLHTWNNTDESLGILLTGKKGLGKSFTANLLCTMLPDLPVIKITREIGKGEGLIDFLNGIKQDHIIYIDEFEKIFTSEDKSDDARLNQKVFLSFLDGGNTTNIKKLFVITTNNDVNDLFINRPTRLRYIREYNSLHIDVIREVVEDKLINKAYLTDLLEHVDSDSINIDILIKVIDEINLHDVPYSTFKEFFNYKINDSFYNVFVTLPGETTPRNLESLNTYSLNQIKNRTNRAWSLGEITIPKVGEYYFEWRGSLIKNIDDKHYELEVEYTLYPEQIGEEIVAAQSSITTVYISKEIKYLTF